MVFAAVFVVDDEGYSLIAELELEVGRILRCRWLLLLPVLGTLICLFLIFNCKLSQLTQEKDSRKLLFANVFAFIGVAVVLKIILGFFGDAAFIRAYQSIIMLIPSLLAVNIPTLWYVNHTFK